MFCTTSKGKESLVRQLSAELHIDSDANLCTSLVRFLSKFHLLSEDDVASETAQKESGGKIMWFRSVDSYCQKIDASFKK
jgi:hypothetical protein